MPFSRTPELPIGVLDILLNPVLVKDANLRYVWVNAAFEKLFNVTNSNLVGRLDTDVFKDRQSVQCNGGDTRVLASGEVDEAYETVFRNGIEPRVTITRKSRLTVADSHYLVGVMHDVTEVTEANKALEKHKAMLEEKSLKLQEMAYSDPLTGVMNRRRLAETAPVIFGTHRNIGVVMTSDLDHFKKINDRYGHDFGDQVLRTVASRVKKVGKCKVFRYGGEEFCLVFRGNQFNLAEDICELVREEIASSPVAIRSRFRPAKKPKNTKKVAEKVASVKVTVSIGIAMAFGHQPPEGVIEIADKALYKAKQTGRNKVVARKA